jgi:signal transduction histidine kinase
MQVYLTMREALRNAVRHSGCSRIGITLEVRDRDIYGLMEDDGEGLDPDERWAGSPPHGA